jgi:hypothetical protein
MNFHLQGGRVGSSQLLNAGILAQTHSRQTRIPDTECKLIHRPPGAERCDYCMGWWLTELDGQPLLQHAGEAVGWRAMVALLPEQKTGVSVFLGGAKDVHQAISYTILEKLLSGGSRDWVALAGAERGAVTHQIESQAEACFPCTPGADASADLALLAGRYRHDACGEVHVSLAGDGLEMRFTDGRLWDMRLTHIGDDVFACRFVRPEARDFTTATWRARFEVKDGKTLWLEDLNARYRHMP